MTDHETSHEWLRLPAAIYAAYPKPAEGASYFLSVIWCALRSLGKFSFLVGESFDLLISSCRLTPDRIVRYYGQEITCQAIQLRLESFKEEASRLGEDHDSQFDAGPVLERLSTQTLGSSAANVVPQESTLVAHHDEGFDAKRAVNRERHIRKESASQ